MASSSLPCAMSRTPISRKLLAAEGALEPRRALSLLAQVAEALDAAHAKGLVHRDVKPSNVLIAETAGSEHCYLADFGLTRRAGSASGISTAGEIVGTLEYVAPEQIAGVLAGRALGRVLTRLCPLRMSDRAGPLPARYRRRPPLGARARGADPAVTGCALSSQKSSTPCFARALAKEPGTAATARRGSSWMACSEPEGSTCRRRPNGTTSHTNLPRPLSSFVGRDAELRELLVPGSREARGS